MVSGSEMKFMSNAVLRTRRSGKQIHAAIRSDVAWNAMLGEDVENE